MTRMNIDLCLDARLPPEELCRLGLLAERHGIRSIWLASYLASRDPFANLVSLAQASSRILMGACAPNPYDTHPVRLATSLLTLNEVAKGRARIIVGGGGEALMALSLKPDRRPRAVGEAVQILKGANAEKPFSFDGQMYKVTSYHPLWAKAPKPPIYVAANKPQMLRMAARYADGIMLSDLPAAICKERIGWVLGHMKEFGRPSAGYWFSNFVAWSVYEDRQKARREARQWLGYRGLFRPWVITTFMSQADYDIIEAHKAEIYAMPFKGTWSVEGVPDRIMDKLVDELTLCGDVSEVPRYIDHLLGLKAAGVTDVCLEIRDDPEKSIRIIGEQLAPALR
jgi:alkanesulfonate monooxygenase SsuD/methylene tetrahydromethanopterin reductase-like flavin-dependent oxidoreductase (luciferase family)